MDEPTKLAFAAVSDLAKQLITLATGIIALEVTFLKDSLRATSNVDVWIVEISWVMLAVSVLAGIQTLMATTGTLAKHGGTSISVYALNIRIPSAVQVLTFIVGLSLSIIYAMRVT